MIRATLVWGVALALASGVTSSVLGCGYHSLKNNAPGERVGVVLTKNFTSSTRVGTEVVRGTMSALAKEGLLREGRGYPRIEVEVLRIDEAPTGIEGLAGAPSARGHEIAVIVRGVLRTEEGGPAYRDTGDIRAQAFVAREQTVSVAEATIDASTLAAARRAGRLLGESVVGHPIASEESP